MTILRKSIPIVLFLCLFATLSAQTAKIDSLEQVLVSGKLKNQEKAELLIDLANASVYIDTAKCRIYAMEALILSQNNNFEIQEGHAHIALGSYYLHTNHDYLALFHYKKAEKIFLKFKDIQSLYTVYHNLTILFDDNNQKLYAGKLLEVAVELGDEAMELKARSMLFDEDDGHEHLEYYLDLYRKSLQLNSVYTNRFALNCGRLLVQINRPEEALPFLHQVRKSAEDGITTENISTVYNYIAEAYTLLNRIDSAEYYIMKAQNSSDMDDLTEMNIYRTCSLIESARGNYRSALDNLMKHHHISDSLAKVGKTTEMLRIKNWHELEQKDNENEILQLEKEKQQQLILILAGSLVIIIVLFALSVFLYLKTAEKNLELKKLHTVKDRLFSVVAHDLRSPMSVLISGLKLANKNMLDTEKQTQLLNDISIRVDDTYSLLDNLLRWSKNQMQGLAPSPVYFDVQKESRMVTDGLQHIARLKSITLNNRIENHMVYVDRDMFAVVVRNLTTNAIKYSSSETEVTLDSELSGDMNMLTISVKDYGTGISQENQERLFMLSETNSQNGTNSESSMGLGLVLCADLVKINGGSIWYTSMQGIGSTFFFSMPVKE